MIRQEFKIRKENTMSGVRFLKTIKALFLSLLIASFAVLSCFPFYANAAGADGEESASRAPWSSVPSPTIKSITPNSNDPAKLMVVISSVVGPDGGDFVTVVMKDQNGDALSSKDSFREGTEQTLSFSPKTSGTFSFTPILSREGEEDKVGSSSTSDFTVYLEKPVIESVTNEKKGEAVVSFHPVPNCEEYTVYTEPESDTAVIKPEVKDSSEEDKDTLLSATLKNLTTGDYDFYVSVKRGDSVEFSDPVSKKINGFVEGATFVTPVFEPDSSPYSVKSDYVLSFSSNLSGNVNIKNEDGTVLAKDKKVEEYSDISFSLQLKEGENRFSYSAVPDKDFHPRGDEKAFLESYEEISGSFTVSFNSLSGSIYAAPNGNATGKGTKDSPLDIFTALTLPSPGQNVVLLGGTYDMSKGALMYDKTGKKNLTRKVTIYSGIDGSSDSPISLTTENGRAVLDFGSSDKEETAGIEFAGDYWLVSGIDITNTASDVTGLLITGSNNVFTDVRAFSNGGTGIMIRGSLFQKEKDDLPHDNLIKNCVSVNNSNEDHTAADGFCTRGFLGGNNVFDGCMAYSNAESGFNIIAAEDAKEMEKVTIQNSVSFSNGYLSDGQESNGEGNGFKLGSLGLPGAHSLINCAAWKNKGSGITNGLTRDIRIFSCTLFNNKGSNLLLTTGSTFMNTDFLIDGLMSIKTSGEDDVLWAEGDQDMEKIYSNTNFYFDGTTKNLSELTVAADWFNSLTDPNAGSKEKILTLAERLRDETGSINLSDYLLLSDKGKTSLQSSGLKEENIGAHFSGNYEVFSNGVGVNRLYNPNSGEHFFTTSLSEAKYLSYVGWNPEGCEWKAPNTGLPVYRVYNPNAGDHHYTSDRAEVETLIKAGWNDEGVAFYYDKNAKSPLYRVYNPNAISGAHHFTANKDEYDDLVSVGWRGEGIAWTVEHN